MAQTNLPQRQWDPKQMYDVTNAERQAIEARAQRRAELKAEWQRKVTNPFRPDGVIFDPAIQRFNAMKVTRYDHFKSTPKTGLVGFFCAFLPIATVTLGLYYSRREFERKCRSGEIPYKDRQYKYT